MQRIPSRRGIIEIFFNAVIIVNIFGIINLAMKNKAISVSGQPIINFRVFKRWFFICCFKVSPYLRWDLFHNYGVIVDIGAVVVGVFVCFGW